MKIVNNYFFIALLILFHSVKPAPYIVTTIADNVVAPAGSLRAAIEAVNNGLNDAIHFSIPGTGVQTITLAANLPFILNPVTIDGYTQPGSSVNTLPEGDNANIRIEIRGGGFENPNTNLGLILVGANSVVRGLAINNFLGDGINTFGFAIVLLNTGNKIVGNFLGTTADGLNVFPNSIGINDVGGGLNIIGSPALEDRNIIAGSLMQGTAISIINSVQDIIQNNYIGTDKSGLVSLPNSFGIAFQNAGFSLIGGLGLFERNIIRADLICYEDLFNPIGNNLIQGNYIGVDVTGKNALSEGTGEGILFSQGSNNNIIDSNVISGCTNGIVLGADSADSFGPGIDRVFQNRIINNIIGLDSSGLISLRNKRSGIKITVSDNNFIGDTSSDKNIISSNGLNGIYFLQKCNANSVSHNYIGVDITGTQARGNLQNGIQLGTSQIEDNFNMLIQNNIISANQANGVLIQSGSNSNTIQFNKIGVDWNGQKALGNAKAGISVLCSDNNNL